MWIVTEHGYFSFVVDRKDPSFVHLRSRLREDLESNFPTAEVYEKPGADYLFRAKVTKVELAERMTQMIMDATITGHFKDEAIRKSAVPKHGSRRDAYYGFWTSLAKMQPYAPYSKAPRPEPVKVWTPPKRDTRPYSGQAKLPFSGSEHGMYGSLRASDYSWDNRSWEGSEPACDPQPIGDHPLDAASDDEFEQIWDSMTPDEQQAYLDEEEATLRYNEANGTLADLGFTGEPETLPGPRDWAQVEADRRASDRNRQAEIRQGTGGGRKRRGRKGRKNRHNQQG